MACHNLEDINNMARIDNFRPKNVIFTHHQLTKCDICKGQLISKCPFGVFKSPKKTKEMFSMISALASKKRSNQKSSVRESK